ncbi:MAG: SPOR domain-containing protein [Gammaproteobacteria bacterium]|nr:SPOR domain-containing protein [Gammaproteobacteria bacterium]
MLPGFYRVLVVVWLLCFTASVNAAPGFITGTTVKEDGDVAVISVQFACKVEYISHLPVSRGSRLRVQIDPTTICTGIAPSLAKTREQYRPLNADIAKLLEIDYDGESPSNPVLEFVFRDAVRYEVSYSGGKNRVIVRVHVGDRASTSPSHTSGAAGVRVRAEPEELRFYEINLSSSRNAHTVSDRNLGDVSPELNVFETEIELAGVTWYRLRLGSFSSLDEAQQALTRLQATHPHAWIDRVKEKSIVQDAAVADDNTATAYSTAPGLATVGLDEIDELMTAARGEIVSGEVSRAVQLYTKVLRAPNHDRHAEAQELLGFAREKNGQMAHAKAEYQRYLSLYPDGEAARRVQQRLAVLLATDRRAAQPQQAESGFDAEGSTRTAPSIWRVNTFFSQYYRRDANQLNDEEEVISQSAIYSDINFDARRRGSRFDFSSRLSAGYRSDMLDDAQGSGNQLRVSYAYADLSDTRTGLRGRIGRQSRNTGGVLGRFDGVSIDYRLTERVLLNAVAGEPVNSATDGLESERSFYGVSANYGPLIEDLEIGVFAVQQSIGGVEDRQALGAEFRYFGENKSLWGLIDFDTSYNELSSAYLQGSWRFASRLTVSASIDQRHSPYLSTGSAMIGQPISTFEELLILMTEEEIRELSVDRSPLATSVTAGVSYSLTPRLQINADMNQTTVDAAPESGGVAAIPESTYQYLSTTLIASNLFREGDVAMLSLRYSDSDSAKVVSINLDTRFPISTRWRVNPRLRIDQREIMSDSSDEWLYTPGIRIQYRHSRKLRVELEAGRQYAQRELVGTDADRESYFVNLGYQAFFH